MSNLDVLAKAGDKRANIDGPLWAGSVDPSCRTVCLGQ